MLQTVIRSVGFGIAGLMALGAIFGAVNTMYSAVANRTREIATLRALGFGSSPVVVSVLFEAVLLSLVGGLIGGGLAWIGFDGYQTTTMNWQSFSQVAFAFKVTPELPGARHVLRRRSWAWSAASSPPFAPLGCRSSQRCRQL